ncbi:hypothetical protein [Haloferula sp. BvORR071]|uniref:hypothetical protein n=1 Tax=Haloferula sp. BvORR071 TaxID=1396141 RepID=UPI000556B0DE|nr:hypothetical protein [Haloferula sp. BvORR071]
MKPARPSPRRRVFKWLAVIILPLVLFFGWVVLGQPGPSGVLAYSKATDGTECVVTQKWNGWMNGEPYTVSFYTRGPDGRWHWQYIDHEVGRWFHCRLEIDAPRNEVRVYCGYSLAKTVQLHPDNDWPEQKPPFLPRALQST